MTYRNIRQTEGKAALGVPVGNGQVLCGKCFAFMPSDAEYCAECGAPLVDAQGVVGSDQEVYPELAKANLLRMRKEYKGAEDICLSILRRFPNNSSANVLLGDIAAERGELDQAVEWYELALDIVPDSTEIQSKLAGAKAELGKRQVKLSVENLGIPEKRAPLGLYAMITLIVAAFAVAAVMIANRNPQDTGPNPNRQIVVGKPAPAQESSKPDVLPAAPQYREDESLAREIAEAAGIGNRALIVSVSEPEGSIRVVMHSVGEDGEWALRAKVAMEVFKLRPNTEKVELQYLSAGEPTPDTRIVERSAYERTQAAEFDQTNVVAVVDALFGHKMESSTPKPPETNTVTPPLGEPGSDSARDGP